MRDSLFFNPLSIFSVNNNKKQMKSMSKLSTRKKSKSEQSFSRQCISWMSIIWERLKIKQRNLRRILRENIDEMRKEWATSIATYKIFFHLLKITKQRLYMAWMLALTIASSGLPYLTMTLESSWSDSLANKSIFITQAGTQLIAGLVIYCIVSFIADLVKKRVLQNIKVSINKKVLRVLHNKNQFLRTLEEDAQTRLAHQQGRLNDKATIVQTLTKELDQFVANFIQMQEFYISFAPMMIMALLQLNTAGIITKGLLFLCITQAAVTCLMMLCSRYLRPSQPCTSHINHNMETDLMKWSNEESLAAESALQRDFQYIMTRCRVAMYPNYIRRVLNNLDNQLKRYTNATALFQFFESINTALTDLISKITSPLFIMIVFLKKYLNSNMSYSELLNCNGPIMMLGIGSSWLGSGMTAYRKTLHIQANHILQMLNSITLDNRHEQSPPRTFEGLYASGSLSYTEQKESNSRILQFTAAIYQAASTKQRALKRYGSEETPILLKPNQMINVIGHNGAGKSIMFNALSKMYPGIDVSPEIRDNPEFSLYCEQNPFEMPAVEGHCWGPRALMHLIWPTEQSYDSDSFSHQHGNTNLDQLMTSTNEYLKALRFRVVVPGVNGKQMIIDDTQGLEHHKISFETMSGGEKAKLRLALYFAMAEVIQPRILMIDEPYNNINELDCVREVLNSIHGKLKNSTILAVTHQDCDSQKLQNYDQVLLVDKTNQDAIRFHGATADYSTWLKQTEPNQVKQVPAHEVYGLPG